MGMSHHNFWKVFREKCPETFKESRWVVERLNSNNIFTTDFLLHSLILENFNSDNYINKMEKIFDER